MKARAVLYRLAGCTGCMKAHCTFHGNCGCEKPADKVPAEQRYGCNDSMAMGPMLPRRVRVVVLD